MNKKVIAYILIGLAVIISIIYLLKSKGINVTAVTGINSAFDTDDNETYNKMKALIPGGVPAWVTQSVSERYKTSPGMLNGKASKALTFHDVVSAVAPNDNGTFPAAPWSGGRPLLWSNEAVMAPMYALRASLIAKYQQL